MKVIYNYRLISNNIFKMSEHMLNISGLGCHETFIAYKKCFLERRAYYEHVFNRTSFSDDGNNTDVHSHSFCPRPDTFGYYRCFLLENFSTDFKSRLYIIKMQIFYYLKNFKGSGA